MDNQHRQIQGYRELSQQDIDQINVIKDYGKALGDLISTLESKPELDQRAVALAKTQLQSGLMWATRAVAQPDGF